MSNIMPQQMTEVLDFSNALDPDNARSLLNITPQVMSKALSVIPQDVMALDPEVLREKAFKTEEDKQKADFMRTAFWLEYNRAQKTQTKIEMKNIHSGVVSISSFIKSWIGNSFKLMYLITPPMDYQVMQHHIMTVAFQKELEILSLDHNKIVYSKEGQPIGEEVDSKLLAVKQKIAEGMRNRLMGMPVNRTMQVNQNFNHDSGPGGAPGGSGRPMSEWSADELQEYVEKKKREKGISDVPSSSGEDFIDVGKKS